jgi:hypothetical protein
MIALIVSLTDSYSFPAGILYISVLLYLVDSDMIATKPFQRIVSNNDVNLRTWQLLLWVRATVVPSVAWEVAHYIVDSISYNLRPLVLQIDLRLSAHSQ